MRCQRVEFQRTGRRFRRRVLGYRIRNAFATAQQNREAYYEGHQKRPVHPTPSGIGRIPEVSARWSRRASAEWKNACRELEKYHEGNKEPLSESAATPRPTNLASAILQDLQSIDFEKMRTFVSETLSSLARI